jgi:phage tail-like protein
MSNFAISGVDTWRPFTAFNFLVELTIPSSNQLICSASFAECDGLEMNMEPKTIQEGGNNGRQIHLIGPVTYGHLSLKRGMTPNMDLWNWFEQVLAPGGGGIRATGEVVMLTSDETRSVQARFILTGCLPLKLKAPALNAKDGAVAIEEMQIAYEMLSIQGPS